MHRAETAFALDSAEGVHGVLEERLDGFGLRSRAPTPGRRLYLDTVDGRLHRQRSALAVARDLESRSAGADPEGAPLDLLWRNAAGAVHGARTHRGIRYAADLPPGELRAEVAHLVEDRRLRPLLEVEPRGASFDVLDGEAKTVARLRVEASRARSPRGGGGWCSLTPTLRVRSVRGHEGQWKEVVRRLESDRGRLRLERLGDARPGDELGLALEAVGGAAALGGLSPAPTLPRDVLVGPGLRAVLAASFEILRAQEPGARAAIDSEYLHDYRVAARRTRSLLGQLGGGFATGEVEALRSELAWLGSITGPLRDLDVFLDDLDTLARGLDPESVEPLREFLLERAREAHADLVEALDSARYRRLLGRWHALLDGADAGPAGAAGEQPTLREVTSERLVRLVRRVKKRGARVREDSPPEVLHRLRLDFKKLRYLLDGTRSLYRPSRVTRFLRAMKRLQNVLGTVNDAAVQASALHDHARLLPGAGRGSVATVIAMGRMVERAEVRGRRARARFRSRFAEFDSKKNTRRFRKLVGEGT